MVSLKEYASRRLKVTKAMKGAAGVVFAGDQTGEPEPSWRPHAHFEYLTGITNEPGAILLFDPTNPVESRREVLFLLSRDPEVEQWNGLRKPLGSELRKLTGMKTVLRVRALSTVLADVTSRTKQLGTLMPLAATNAAVSEDVALWNKVLERSPGREIVNYSGIIPKLRSVKSAAEIKTIQAAIDMTSRGFADAMACMKPGVNEFQIQATLEYGYAMEGARGSAFPPIVGSGVNSTVLHYNANDQQLASGDLVCIDSGAFHAGYGADISRTIPVSGKFTKRQKEIYELVLRAEEAAIKAVKPGITMGEVDSIARAIIVKAGYGDFFIHGIGHHLGLETHDNCGPMAPLKKGAVVTIEPGIYLPDESLGVRIEDDIAVTASGHKNLSRAIPKSVAAIEKAMRG